MKDFHGDDMTGKDGPLVKAGMDLLTLYHSRAASGADASLEQMSSDDVSGMQVRDGRVLIDATARGDADALADALRDLGATSVEVASPVVSARLPVSRIPDAARLDALQMMRPSRPMTNQGASRSDQEGLAAAATGSGETSTAEASDTDAAGTDAASTDESRDAGSDEGMSSDAAEAPSQPSSEDEDAETASTSAPNDSSPTSASTPSPESRASLDAEDASSTSGGGADGVLFFFLLSLVVVLFFET